MVTLPLAPRQDASEDERAMAAALREFTLCTTVSAPGVMA
jgi:hypothetical protein